MRVNYAPLLTSSLAPPFAGCSLDREPILPASGVALCEEPPWLRRFSFFLARCIRSVGGESLLRRLKGGVRERDVL